MGAAVGLGCICVAAFAENILQTIISRSAVRRAYIYIYIYIYVPMQVDQWRRDGSLLGMCIVCAHRKSILLPELFVS